MHHRYFIEAINVFISRRFFAKEREITLKPGVNKPTARMHGFIDFPGEKKKSVSLSPRARCARHYVISGHPRSAFAPIEQGSDLCVFEYKEEGRKCGVLGFLFPQEELSPGLLLNSTRVGFTAALRPRVVHLYSVNEPTDTRTRRQNRSFRLLPRVDDHYRVCFIKLGHFTARTEH